MGELAHKELATMKRTFSPVAGLGTFRVICIDAAERASEARPKVNEAIRKARRSRPGTGGIPIVYVELAEISADDMEGW